MQGPYMLQRVRRVVLNKHGQEVGFSDGTVMGHLPVAQADYISEFTGKPEALWRIKFDDSSMGEEDLEWVEVEDAISNYQRKARYPNHKVYWHWKPEEGQHNRFP